MTTEVGESPPTFNAMKSVRGRTVKQRFEEKFRRGEMCWEWIGSRTKKGYGQLMIGGRPIGAHRVAWELHAGSIPSGLHVLHHCDNPSCVRPDHLFLGTNLDNIADCKEKGRARVKTKGLPGENNPHAKLNEADAKIIRNSTEKTRLLAARFNVHRTTIQRMRRASSWTHL